MKFTVKILGGQLRVTETYGHNLEFLLVMNKRKPELIAHLTKDQAFELKEGLQEYLKGV